MPARDPTPDRNPAPDRTPAEDRAFERYRAEGDGAALAEVFDLTAPALLAFARSTVADHHLSEDLVQQTFVAAIESRAAWDPERPLLPWLMGILAHRARNLGRRERRRRGSRLDASPGGTALADATPRTDPQRAASDREFAAAFRDGIDALPDPYGPVLDMHLRHGLTAAEIARTLRRPAGTVRTQIVRGSRMLRAALPQGFAVAGAAIAVHGTALAAARRAVLHHASTAGTIARPALVGIGAATLSALLMNKPLAALAALLTLCLSVAVAVSVWPAADDAPNGPASPALDIAADRAVAGSPSADDAAAPAPAPAANARRVAVGPGPEPTAAPLTVRVLQEWDHQPARLVRVVVTDELGAQTELTTEADGTCRADLAGGALRVDLPDFDQSATPPRGEGAEPVVEFRVDPRLDLEVRVATPDGTPVASAQLFAFHGLGPELTRTGFGHTDARGVARVRTAAASLSLRASAAGYLPSGPSLLIAKRPPRGPVQIALGAQARPVRIEVSDPDGRPAAGAHLEVYLPGRPFVHPLIATTSANGTAQVELPEEPSLIFAAAGGGAAPAYVLRDVPAATTTVALRLEAPATVTGTARDAHGAPVANAQIAGAWGHPRLPGVFARGWRRDAVTGADGSYVLDGLVPGTTSLTLVAPGRRVEAERELQPGPNAPWDPVVPPPSTWTVRLTSPSPAPLSGWLVELASDHPQWNGAGAVTDAEGVATFEGLPRDPQVATVRVEARAPLRGVGVSGAFDGATASAWQDVATSSDGELEVPEARLPSARLRGAVHGPDGLPAAGVEVSLLRRIEGRPVVIQLVCDQQGRFEYGPTAPGSLSLAIRDPRGAMLLPDLALERDQALELGALYLGEPANVAVRLRFDLEAPTVAIRLGRGREAVPLQRGEDGAWRAPTALPPGDYVVEVRERDVVVREHALFVKSGSDATVELR